MPELTLCIDGATQRIAFEPGPSVREILDATDFRVRSGCRGIGACGLCRVRVEAGEAGASEESAASGAAGVRAGSSPARAFSTQRLMRVRPSWRRGSSRFMVPRRLITVSE